MIRCHQVRPAGRHDQVKGQLESDVDHTSFVLRNYDPLIFLVFLLMCHHHSYIVACFFKVYVHMFCERGSVRIPYCDIDV